MAVEKWAEWVAEVAGSALIVTAAWGAAGGLTNALSAKMTLREAIRHIAMGALIACGAGGIVGDLFAHWVLPEGTDFRTGAGIGVSAFLAGAFGAAILERIRETIRDDDEDNPPKPPH